eukprot:480170_1
MHINDIINDSCSIHSVVSTFQHMLQNHSDEFDEIYDALIIKCNNNQSCNLSNCALLSRSYRNRSRLFMDDVQRKKLYFNYSDTFDVVAQQILDKIHCYYFHSIDIGYKLSEEDKRQIKHNMDTECKNDDNNDIMSDKTVKYIYKCIDMRKQSPQMNQINTGGTKFASPLDKLESSYSFGITYFYWTYYENSVESIDPLTRHGMLILEYKYSRGIEPSAANDGFRCKDFYVVPKYKDLKEELLNNDICVIDATQFDNLSKKAEIHLRSEHFTSKIASKHYKEHYDIAENTPISLQHISAIMVYCNYDLLQQKFSETYRPICHSNDIINHSQYMHNNQQSVAIGNAIMLCKRHSNYAHLGRLLRECVGVYGLNALEVTEMRLYHGLTKILLFASINTCIKGPISTTTEYAVGLNFATSEGNQGMILELCLNDESLPKVFDCQHISDFPNE